MPLNPSSLESALKGAVFDELQSQFLDGVPPEHQDAVSDQNEKLAIAVSKVAAEIISHIQQNMEATSTVTTTVSTTVATAGSPTAQTGAGTGSGTGTGTIAPGSFM
jgi:hypothetical protein